MKYYEIIATSEDCKDAFIEELETCRPSTFGPGALWAGEPCFEISYFGRKEIWTTRAEDVITDADIISKKQVITSHVFKAYFTPEKADEIETRRNERRRTLNPWTI